MAKVHDIDAGLTVEQQIGRVVRRVTNADGTLNEEAAARERKAIAQRIRRRAIEQEHDRRWLKMIGRAFDELRRIDIAEGKR